MTDDIVARLRAVLHHDRSVELMAREAAAEIERLRAVNEAWAKYSQRAERDIERLRKERDEARRELCAARRELCRDEAIIRLQRHRVHRDSEDVAGLAKEIAVERGWDCFKEDTDGR